MCTARQMPALVDTATRQPKPVSDAWRSTIAALEGSRLRGAAPGHHAGMAGCCGWARTMIRSSITSSMDQQPPGRAPR